MKSLSTLLRAAAILAALWLTVFSAGAETCCWNIRRGFNSFSTNWTTFDPEDKGIVENLTAETVELVNEPGPFDKAEFRFKVHNLNCTPGKKYHYLTESGERKKAEAPGWLTLIKDSDGKTLAFRFAAGETDFDGISSSPMLRIESLEDGVATGSSSFSNSRTPITDKFKNPAGAVDPTGALGSYKLVIDDGRVSLYGGLHGHVPLHVMHLPDGFRPARVGLALEPGAKLKLADIRLTTDKTKLRVLSSPWSDTTLLEEYLEDSEDSLEGYWQILDRSLEETLLKPGGDYRLAITRGDRGYDIIYISGAKVNGNEWIPGMIKATLAFSGIEGIFDVNWFDPMFCPIDGEIKAQLDAPGTLRIQFPYQSSSLRLQRVR